MNQYQKFLETGYLLNNIPDYQVNYYELIENRILFDYPESGYNNHGVWVQINTTDANQTDVGLYRTPRLNNNSIVQEVHKHVTEFNSQILNSPVLYDATLRRAREMTTFDTYLPTNYGIGLDSEHCLGIELLIPLGAPMASDGFKIISKNWSKPVTVNMSFGDILFLDSRVSRIIKPKINTNNGFIYYYLSMTYLDASVVSRVMEIESSQIGG